MCCKGDNSVLLETDQLMGKVLKHIRESKTIRGKEEGYGHCSCGKTGYYKIWKGGVSVAID